MYHYDAYDHAIVRGRAEEFRDQVARRLTGELNEDEFRPFRLMNGLYLQLHAYMLRVAIPYGVFNSDQMRAMATIARTWDKGYGHFTTRQNIQFNWPALKDVPDILDHLAGVEMHAIQTSGNCIRNTTTDPYAGVAGDEIADPRPWAELIRQWSTLHPEFTFLPRKFKIAITGGASDRAATAFHDIGLKLVRGSGAQAGALGFTVLVGGGMGRTPRLARTIRDFLPAEYLLSYLEAILRVYNLHGRRDNKYKARIKILVDETGIDTLRQEVEAEWDQIRRLESIDAPEEEIERLRAAFAPPALPQAVDNPPALAAARAADPAFAAWCDRNLFTHQRPGYVAVTVSLKPPGGVPGDISAEQMDGLADLADRFSAGELRATKEQNLILPWVRQDALPALFQALAAAGLATPTKGLVTDVIACPGLDYCALANARSIPLAQDITRRLAPRAAEVGTLAVNISGCINACGHHHAAAIGILGVDKRGDEAYQLVLGGHDGDGTEAAIAASAGPGYSAEGVVDALETVVETYLALRAPGEAFLSTLRRLGAEPFKEALHAAR